MTNNNLLASELLHEFVSSKQKVQEVTLQEICDYLSDRGFAILLILFSLPMSFPIPTPPGFTTILGLPLLYLSWQMIRGDLKPTLPKWVARKTIKTSHLSYVLEKFGKVLIYLEKISKPRYSILCSAKYEIFAGYLAFFCALSISLPIIFGNAIPSLGILIMSISILNRDGFAMIIGYIISIIGLCITSAVLYFIFFSAKAVLDGSIIDFVTSIFKSN